MYSNREAIIEKVKNWITSPDNTVEKVSDPGIIPDETIFHVKEKKLQNYLGQEGKASQFFVAFPSSIEALTISTYFYFDKSDATGFTILPTEHKIIFANEMKIPLLTLGLWYTWIPGLENIESLEMKKLIYFDGFSQNAFSDGLTHVLNGYEIVSSRYEQFVNYIHRQKK